MRRRPHRFYVRHATRREQFLVDEVTRVLTKLGKEVRERDEVIRRAFKERDEFITTLARRVNTGSTAGDGA